MVSMPDHVSMEMLIVFALLIAAGLASVLFGDRRDPDERDHRRWFPGAPR